MSKAIRVKAEIVLLSGDALAVNIPLHIAESLGEHSPTTVTALKPPTLTTGRTSFRVIVSTTSFFFDLPSGRVATR